ncbi:MAG: acyl-CoA dehydrogenase family protein [Candidatus Heimdallarchaeota archaeon]|nr:MAG: acyl-CoA dehydrogenase family protein [Candidatus Heimdallarchaeota archaeon]
MIDFSLTDDQKKLQLKAREFAINEIIPVSRKYDQSGEFPREVLQKAFDQGLMNTIFPQNIGGPGLGVLDTCLIVEETAAADPGITTSLFDNCLGAEPILIGGTKEQIDRFLKPLTKELKFIAFATSEPGMGSDVAGLTATARLEGDEIILNGRKMWVTNGGVASLLSTFCRLEGTKRHKGITGVVVPMDSEGVKVGKPIPKMGHKASNTVMVRFNEVHIPTENILGEPGKGFPIAMQTFAHTRPTIGAFACGLARAAMEYAIAYAKRRKAFESEIANFQAIQFMLADMKIHIDAARLLTWKAAWEADQGRDNTISASVCKSFASDYGMKAVSDALQIFGGYGYTTNYLIEKLFRDAKLYQIYEGTSQIQRMVIARHLLSRYNPVFEKTFS